MKKTTYILLLLILCSVYSNAQFKITSVKTSAFYTYGNYNNINSSASLAAYATMGLNYFDYLTLGADRLTISNPEWNYTQYALTGSFIKNLYPLYLSLNYLYINGSLNWKPNVYSYTDNLHYIGAGINYNYNLFYVGASYHWMNLNGYKSVIGRQYEVKASYIASSKLTIGIKPLYSSLSDGRNLLSISGEVTFRPFNKLELTASGFVGERAYYFNDYLLLIYNQDETQKSLAGIKAAFSISNSANISGGFQFTEFESYNINYYLLGLSVLF